MHNILRRNSFSKSKADYKQANTNCKESEFDVSLDAYNPGMGGVASARRRKPLKKEDSINSWRSWKVMSVHHSGKKTCLFYSKNFWACLDTISLFSHSYQGVLISKRKRA